MKKLSCIGFILVCHLFSPLIFANTNQDGPTLIYCPETINCSADGQLTSCKATGVNSEYWSALLNSEGRIAKGVYKLKKVSSTYQSQGDWNSNNATFCQYNNIEGSVEKLISTEWPMTSRVRIEAYLNNATQWQVAGYKAECFSSDTKLCPLAEEPALVVSDISFPSFPYYLNGVRGRMYYDTALSMWCASGDTGIKIKNI